MHALYMFMDSFQVKCVKRVYVELLRRPSSHSEFNFAFTY